MLGRTLFVLAVLGGIGCSATSSDDDGTSGEAATVATTGSATAAISASSSSGIAQATSPEECEALSGTGCQEAGCIAGFGFRFPEGVAACQVEGLSCDDAEPITLCIYDEPNTAYLFVPLLIHRVVGQQTEVVLIGGRPIFGTIPAWTLACEAPPVCPGFESAPQHADP